ncbi:laccase-1 precursor [Grosmannia clavigera kw1407]|uniref:Laccase-1 n=1 Tax=Grosmannia clavigera (strain kw1407 / UAMH 11150) TaxID=655863 RepID=F0XK69_GROCL|nr:laccase-1 precursor [Grosmannia clavigera kw1407]EFX01919.1 laccase-1 precursor [Grosmannia clavigera kw1407]
MGWLHGLIVGLLPHLTAALSQSQTNGLIANGTDAYANFPTTGVIRSYEWTVSRGTLAPDGYEMPVILVNGQFPGPTIEANWGDTIQVTVHNKIRGPEEGTAIHWHGLPQQGTPWEDGVPAATQCPIAPGASFTYQFQVTVYGTSWYHAHYSAQYGAGLLGPLIIYGPTEEPYDVDTTTRCSRMLAPGGQPEVSSDNNLINGKNRFDCATKAAGDDTPCTSNASQAQFFFEAGRVHRLRLANTGAEGLQRFSIDGHTLQVIAYDFVPIEPYETKLVTLGVGQRADVLVTADQGTANTSSSFWMRSSIASCSTARQPRALAAVHYVQPSNTTAASVTAVALPVPSSSPWSGPDVPDPSVCANDDLQLTRPLFAQQLPAASWTHDFDVELFVNGSNVTLWKFDSVSFRGDYNAPTLLLASLGNTSWPEEWNARNLYTSTSVRMIVNNHSPSQHPMHLHGSDFYVLHEGPGEWDGTIVESTNPMRRDVQIVRPNGHLVLQMNADNPGVWPFHCHIAWHSSGGFLSQLIVQPSKLQDLQIPSVMAQTCRDWASWTKTHIPDQIDSGL